jgi:outer membrane protein assembly factor BamD (BamD/ComL family)
MVASLLLGCGSAEEEAHFKLSKAIHLQSAGEFVRAKRHFERILSDYPETQAAQDAMTMLDQVKTAMLNGICELQDRGKFPAAEKLCERILSEYPGTKEADSALAILDNLKERYNRVAAQNLRQAYGVAQDYFLEYPGERVDLEKLRYFGLEESGGVTIGVVDGRQDELVMMSGHASGNKMFTVFYDGRLEEERKE